ncbi:MAG TPA: cell division protein SepF [Syntrophomonadaceae bacterium]|nr:cell division protein SepF [Syntrophomonadaceae bacterium]
MSSVKEKIMYWFGLEEEYDEEYGFQPATSANEGKASHVVGLPSARGQKVVVCEPTNFEEAQAITEHLKSRKQVIVNFEMTPIEISKKIIDFVSGAAYGLDGTSQQIGCKVFLFAPSGVEVTPDGKTTFSLPSEKILRSYRDFRD